LERELVTVQEAARRLGITESAVRKRIQRGLVDYDKKPDGRVYIYVDMPDNVQDKVPDNSYPLIVERLENEVEFLRRELERRDHLLAAALERIPPQIEAPQEPRESPERADSPGPRERPFTDEERAQEAAQPRSGTPWWRRMFGG
jgi:predicted ArsR family transcriptional regulator